MTMMTVRRTLRAAARILANVLGVLVRLGTFVVIGLAVAIALGLTDLGWDTFVWLVVAEVGAAAVSVALLAASGGLPRRDAPSGSWATH